MNGYIDAFLELASGRAKIKTTLSPGATWFSDTTKTQMV